MDSRLRIAYDTILQAPEPVAERFLNEFGQNGVPRIVDNLCVKFQKHDKEFMNVLDRAADSLPTHGLSEDEAFEKKTSFIRQALLTRQIDQTIRDYHTLKCLFT
jgi:hypothetical protein